MNRTSFKTIATLLACLMALQGLAAWQIKDPDVSGPIPIHSSLKSDMFPREWRERPIYAQATAIDKKEVTRSLRNVKRAVAKYPAAVLKNNLKRVFLVRSMNFFGVPYGGTNSYDTIYLCNNGELLGFTDYYLEQIFHHELSSILLRKNPDKFTSTKWLAVNPKGFSYFGDGTMAVKEAVDSIQYYPLLYNKGFLTQYSQANIEEDFNTIAEGLFLGNPEYWRAIDSSRSLKAKCRIAISFYHQIDSTFSEKRFRSFVKH